MKFSALLSIIFLTGCAAVPHQSYDREKVRLAINSHKKAFKACYDEALNRDKDVKGRVVIEFDIETEGKVTKAFAITNDTKDAVLGACLSDKVKSITFPEPPDAEIARVRYPFVFSSQKR